MDAAAKKGGTSEQGHTLPSIKAVHSSKMPPGAGGCTPLASNRRRPAEPDTASSSECNTPFQGHNELFKITSMRQRMQEREYWQSLPSCSKAHLILSGLASCSILAFCIQQFVTTQEDVHILVVELIAAAVMVWMAVEAVYHENAFELLASATVACAVAARILYFIAHIHVASRQLPTCIIILVLLGLDLGMAIASYKQFGWRMYGKIACDFRTKSGLSKQRTYLLIHSFLTILKVDLLVMFSLFVIGVVAGLHGSDGNNLGLLIINPLGLAASFAWLLLSFITVRNDWSRMEVPLVVALPVCYVAAGVSIALAYGQENTVRQSARTSLVVVAILFILVRSLTVIVMQVLVIRFRVLHAQSMRTLSDSSKRPSNEGIPAELLPLMKGTWVGKPSANAQQKRRFFQLSKDGSTLRWAWNKYVLLYYVEEQVDNAASNEITLKMLMEPELKLRFENSRLFNTWRKGLTEARRLLEDPGNMLQSSLQDPCDEGSMTHGWLKMLLLEPPSAGGSTYRSMLKQLFSDLAHFSLFSKRRSIHDPDLLRFNEAKRRAHHNHASKRMGLTPEAHAHKRSSSEPLGTSKSMIDRRHKRGNTIPSIAEIVDAIAQQESEKIGVGEIVSGLQRQRSAGKKFRELVIDCISPNTRRIRVRQWGGSPSATRSAARELFTKSRNGPESQLPQSPFAAQTSKSPFKDSEGNERPRFDIQANSATPHIRHSRARSLTFSKPSHEAGQGKGSLAQSQSLIEQLTTPAKSAEILDSEESLDKVGPLPDILPGQAALRSPLNPATLAPLAIPSSVESSASITALEPRFDAALKASNVEIVNPQVAIHPLIQRTRTTSSSGSFYGHSPLPSRANSGTYVSESSSNAYSWPSTNSSNSSLCSGGQVKMSVPYIPIQEIIMGRCLGEGSQGRVHAGSYLETPVAIKRLKDVREMEMSLHIGMHDNVVALRGISQEDQDLVLVMEYCPKGTFGLLLHGTASRGELDAFKMTSWARAIARGMLHLHTRSPPILHRDLKPANIFVGHGFVMKIGDFGMSRHVDVSKRPDGKTQLTRQLSSDVIGTTHYTAPELLKIFDDPEKTAETNSHEMTTEGIETILKSDVYSFGVTLWEMMTRKKPFSEMHQFQIIQAWMEDPDQMELVLPPIPAGLSDAARTNLEGLSALVRDCTQSDPTRRPSFRHICQRIRELPMRNSSNVSDACVVDNAQTSSKQFNADLASVL